MNYYILGEVLIEMRLDYLTYLLLLTMLAPIFSK